MKLLAYIMLQIVHEVMSSEEEVANCTGKAIISDFDNRPHRYEGNETNIVMHAVKESVVSIIGRVIYEINMFLKFPLSGTCCFSLFTRQDGYGDNQIIGPEGEYRLELDDLKSIFRVECEGWVCHFTFYVLFKHCFQAFDPSCTEVFPHSDSSCNHSVFHLYQRKGAFVEKKSLSNETVICTIFAFCEDYKLVFSGNQYNINR